MSHKLADGSLSTDYKVGDKFTHEREPDIFVFIRNDGTVNPWFKKEDDDEEYARHWDDLTPVKTTKHSTLIKSIRETMQYLERTIQELES